MAYVGDIRLASTLNIKFCTVGTTGAPTTLAGTPVISAYVGSSLTQLTAGITLTVDFDGVTGLHNVTVVATGANGYTTATDVQLVITTGTVGGTSVVGYVVAEFSIENRSPLMSVTAANKTVVVDANGLIDATAVKLGPTGAGTAQTARDLGLAIPAAVAGAAGGLFIAGTNAPTAITTALTTNITGNITGNLVGTVSTLTTYTGNTPQTGDTYALANGTSGFVATKVDTAAILVDTATIDTAGEIAAAVWSADATTYQTAGTFGQAIGDPGADANTIFANVTAILADTATIDTAGEIAAAVWSADATTYQTQGTFGQAIGDPVADANTIYKAVVTDATGATVGVDTAAIVDDTGTAGVVVAAASKTGYAIGTGGIAAAAFEAGAVDAAALNADAVDEILDETVGDGTLTMRQVLRVLVAGMAAKLSGAATTTVTIRNVADSANVVVATVDADGNRTATTVTP